MNYSKHGAAGTGPRRDGKARGSLLFGVGKAVDCIRLLRVGVFFTADAADVERAAKMLVRWVNLRGCSGSFCHDRDGCAFGFHYLVNVSGSRAESCTRSEKRTRMVFI